jgi:hypothetical protein
MRKGRHARVAYGTPEAVVERLLEHQEVFGIMGVSLDMRYRHPEALREPAEVLERFAIV